MADPVVRLRTPQTAAVTVDILPGSSTRALTAVPVQIRDLPDGLRGRLAPATVAVTVRGTEAAMAALTAESLDAQVDARGLPAGEHTVEVRVRAGHGLTIEGITRAGAEPAYRETMSMKLFGTDGIRGRPGRAARSADGGACRRGAGA